MLVKHVKHIQNRDLPLSLCGLDINWKGVVRLLEY